MLRSMKDLRGFTLKASDGDIGSVDEFYFDDERWAVRYMVVNTGTWLGRRVLISPVAFRQTDWKRGAMDVSLTRDQIRNSPDADLHAPISRQYERGYFGYYGYAPYWGGANYWGPAAYPGALATSEDLRLQRTAAATALEETPDAHVHSSADVLGYHIQASDGEIGHVDDFIVDDKNWAIRYLRVDTSNWIGGKPVLVPQRSLREVIWGESKIHVALSRDQVRNSPEYNPSRLNREYEEHIDKYYGVGSRD